MFKELDHIGIAVPSIEEYLPLYAGVLGMKHVKTEEVADQKVKVAFFDVGGTHIELIEPVSDDSGVAKHLEKRGPGMHHLAFRVDDIEKALSHAENGGIGLVDKTPRTGAGGKKIAFLHPKSTRGVLMELVEVPGN